MVKEIIFKDIGCAKAFDVAFDYIAIVEQIKTWNLSNDINMIDSSAKKTRLSDEDKEKFTFIGRVDPTQQVIRSEGQIVLGKDRIMLVGNKSYNKGTYNESYRTWHIQAKNKDKEWYTSDVITIHSVIVEDGKSDYTLSIRSNSRDLKEQVCKQKFPIEFGAPAMYKIAKSNGAEEIEVDMHSVGIHKWQLQDEIMMKGAIIEGSGKIYITIPKQEDNSVLIKSFRLLKSMYGFKSEITHDDDYFHVETSEYIFNKIGLTRFIDECRGNKERQEL